MNYEQIFQERGASYDRAMQRWPNARSEEFLLPVQWSELRAGDRVIDVPAGGGYLRSYLPSHCEWFGHEPAEGFLDGTGSAARSLLPLPWPDAFAHAAISIAGIHHLVDKRPLFADLRRVLKPGGRIVLADVHVDSAVSAFLDEFVGAHNSTGHSGYYLDEGTVTDLQAGGFRIVRSQRVRYCWWFESLADMGAFCRMLFDMRGLEDEHIAKAIERRLGLRSRPGEVGMQWELFAVAATRISQGDVQAVNAFPVPDSSAA